LDKKAFDIIVARCNNEDNLSFLDSLILEGATDRLSRNVATKLTISTA